MLGWDEAVMMPAGGGSVRDESIATLAATVHRMIGAEETAELIQTAETETL